MLNLSYNYRNYIDKCGNKDFWNSQAFYANLKLFKDRELTIPIETKIVKITKTVSDVSMASSCANIVRRVIMKTIYNEVKAVSHIEFELMYQEQSGSTSIDFSHFPIFNDESTFVDYVERNGGFVEGNQVKFGSIGSLVGKSSVNAGFPISALEFKSDGGECIDNSNPELFGVQTKITFGNQLMEACRITIAKENFGSFCSNYKERYQIFSRLIRLRQEG